MSTSLPSAVYPARPPHYHGFCWSCCHPAELCCCGWLQCRKEAKELLVSPGIAAAAKPKAIEEKDRVESAGAFYSQMKGLASDEIGTVEAFAMMHAARLGVEAPATTARGAKTAFIGGGCCVHLSVEYMPANPALTPNSLVVVLVVDSEKTIMAWAQAAGSGSVYQVRESIITTKPGAHLAVAVWNMTARVRWCEVFSC